MTSYIESLKWRYAVKKYDASRKVSEADLEVLKEAIRYSASAYGLQPYTVFIIENPELREKLLPAAYGQRQVVDASHLFVFASQTSITPQQIDTYVQNIAETRELTVDSLSGLGDYMKNALVPMSEDSAKIWTAKQTYIAVGNLLSAAAGLKIDAGAMEGFDPQQFNEILGLDKRNLNAAVIAAVGYRAADDAAQHQKKVRKSTEDLFIKL